MSVVRDLIHPCVASGRRVVGRTSCGVIRTGMAERQARGGRAKEGIGGPVINRRTPLAQEPVACGGRFKRGNCSVKFVCRATPISLHPRA